MSENLRIWDQVKEVPQDAQSKITGGRLQGMTNIKPIWRLMAVTNLFGPCGIGWKYEIEKQWTLEVGGEVLCFCNVLVYVSRPIESDGIDRWSEPIPGTGSSKLVSRERNGMFADTEGYKKALTDALSVAFKALGVGANVYAGGKDFSCKYEEPELPASAHVQEASAAYSQVQPDPDAMRSLESAARGGTRYLQQCWDSLTESQQKSCEIQKERLKGIAAKVNSAKA